MASDSRRILSRALIAGVVVAALGLTGCGRKGPLEPPPGASLTTANPDDPDAAGDGGTTKPDKPFLLDPLI